MCRMALPHPVSPVARYRSEVRALKVLVAVGSHLGSTTAIGERIGAILRDAGLDVSVQAAENAGPAADYEAFVIGGGTYAGRWHPDAVAFVRRHVDVLTGRPVWLFSSGPLGDAGASAPPHDPVEMAELARIVRARDHPVFAGAHDRSHVDQSDLSRIEKFVANRFISSGDWRDWEAIETWARGIAHELAPASINSL
jgi:menaquinone-dependent protoporphyrinogen oxidase